MTFDKLDYFDFFLSRQTEPTPFFLANVIDFLFGVVYVDMGNQGTDTTTLTFAFSTTTTTRNWEIKVTQVECSNPSR